MSTPSSANIPTRQYSYTYSNHRVKITDAYDEQNTSRVFPSVVPDSQPDSDSISSGDTLSLTEIDISCEDRVPDADTALVEPTARSGSLGDQRTIPGELKPKSSSHCFYRLHSKGFNINGRLANEASGYISSSEIMTQPATQPFVDPRREGSKSMLSDQDEADVLCILLPSSGPALKAVELIHAATPQHILQNHFSNGVYDSNFGALDANPIAWKTQSASSHDDEDDASPGQATQAETQDFPTNVQPQRDIALRMSSKVHNPVLGFVFGRNPSRCDLLLSEQTTTMKLSNCHFRIFVNTHGVLMIEDTSTNGTYVDKTLLRSGKRIDPTNPSAPPSRWTLSTGSIISLPNLGHQSEESMRFIVRYPSRNNEQERYNQNIGAYIQYIQQAERQAEVAAAKGGNVRPQAPMPFNVHFDKREHTPQASILAAATGEFNHGMHWNGGDKYNVIGYIGHGSFATVYKLSNKRDGKVFACKQIEKKMIIKDGMINNKIHNEINVMKKLEHPSIVKFVEYHETQTHIFIIMEFVPYGDLSHYTHNGTAMPEYVCEILARQMLEALKYLHERNITHRDIKPDNILFADEKDYKISDFGLSKIVSNEQTFLKTFCGTLLYCAPEIYPGFERAKAGLHPNGKRTREWEPRVETRPYQHSVDIWSIGAVLFHLLCGHAPYAGTNDNNGATMLVNIMSGPPDWERLEQAGVSALGINCIQRMLVIDPAFRASEDALLAHPWIRGAEEPMHDFHHPSEDLDASQLSLADPADSPTGGNYANVAEGLPPPKRQRHKGWEPKPVIDSNGMVIPSNDDCDLPSLGAIGGWNGTQMPAPTHQVPAEANNVPRAPRLFGEIGASALQSSGALGENANVALQVPTLGNYDPFTSNSDSFIHPDRGQWENLDSGVQATGGAIQQHEVNYPQLVPGPSHVDSAASLLGAEAQIRQLNMASSESEVSHAPSESQQASPKASTSSRVTTAVSGLHEKQVNPKRIENVSKESTILHSREAPTPNTGRSQMSNYNSQDSDLEEGQRLLDSRKSDASLLPTAFNSQESDCSKGNTSEALKGQSPQKSSPQTIPASTAGASVAPTPDLQSAFRPKEDRPVFAKPPQRFGNLIPVPGSVHSIPIKISQYTTTFGRDPSSDFTHPNVKEDRVPKRALDIIMWYPKIEKDIAKGKTDWQSNESLTAIVSTRTSLYIKVNGVRLMKGRDCWLYGRLKTGDIITIFGPLEGRANPSEKDKEYLRFRCEFFVGASKEPRSETEPFVVETEKEKYRLAKERESRESSHASLENSRSIGAT